jgi:S-methylmethionine-dependent homocysteine/selenocysteine methylase
MSLAAALAQAPVVLDGGFATQLEAQGNDLSSALWSARLLQDEPEQIVAAHRAFLDAGARVIETATYQATFEGFASIGMDTGEAAALMGRGSDLARQAVDEFHASGNTDTVYIAASVGPYGAMLADGSEYTGAYDKTVSQLRDFHLRRLSVLAPSGVDVLALETVPNRTEVEALVLASDELDVPAWISISIDGLATRAGDVLDETFAIAASGHNVIAIGVNCSTSSDVTTAIPLAARYGKPVVVYPNSGEGWDAEARAWTGSGDFSPTLVTQWVADGARLIGGCCRVTPAHIAGIAATLD